MHLVFARTGWLGRYEAWLIAMLAVMLAPTAQRLFERAREGRWMLRFILPIALLLFGLFPVRERVASTLFQANRGSTNIYEQQVQMARFLAEYRTGESIALNDIGAVGYFSGVDVVDLWGLSDVDIAERRLAGHLNPIEVDWAAQTRGVEVVAMYGVRARRDRGRARWTGCPSRSGGSAATPCAVRPALSWYATSAEDEPRLRSELEAWSAQLPPTVDVRWR